MDVSAPSASPAAALKSEDAILLIRSCTLSSKRLMDIEPSNENSRHSLFPRYRDSVDTTYLLVRSQHFAHGVHGCACIKQIIEQQRIPAPLITDDRIDAEIDLAAPLLVPHGYAYS